MFIKKEIIFDKYKKRGGYHWQGIGNNIFYSNAFLKARYQLVLDYLPKLTKSQTVLDIGCGDGALSYLISKIKGGRIFGVDPSQEAVRIAKRKFKEAGLENFFFKKGSGYKLPFKNQSFNFVILADVIEHVLYPQKILKEAKRVLKKNGFLIVSSVIKQNSFPEDKMHIREYSVDELKKITSKFFKCVNIKTTHCQYLKKIYLLSIKMGRFRPQFFRYLINIICETCKINPFLWHSPFKNSCQSLFLEKK